MNIIDLHNPNRVKKEADNVIILLSDGNFIQDEFKISRVELRLYNEKVDEKLGRVFTDYFFCRNKQRFS